MFNPSDELTLFIDYDNLLDRHKKIGIPDIIRLILSKLPQIFHSNYVTCRVRLYSGWYEGTEFTRTAQDFSRIIQNEFPQILRLSDTSHGNIHIKTEVELATTLMQEPQQQIYNTIRKKGMPTNIRFLPHDEIGCADEDCVIKLIKKLLKKGRCPKKECSVVLDNVIYRYEQKTVDTLLTCDLIYSAHSLSRCVILVSSDDDFLPPLRTLMLLGKDIYRFHTKPNARRDKVICNNTQLNELEL